MAKRRQLEPPSPEALRQMEEGFARETSPSRGLRMPIADVVADAAAHANPLPAEDRAERARDRRDAERLRDAEQGGLLAVAVPLAEIDAEALTRDRLQDDAEAMEELVKSLLNHGLRLPVEVYELPHADEGGPRYGLISGYRRLKAMRQLFRQTEADQFATIKAFVRSPENAAQALVAMVEENEVRLGLSQYERGRAAAMAVQHGHFATLDDAVAALFSTASKAKRSKIRSFALIHEELGDVLAFGPTYTERQCLRLATALRGQGAEDIRQALVGTVRPSAQTEWTVLEPFIEAAEGATPDPARGGRPRSTPPPTRRYGRKYLGDDLAIEKERGPNGFLIRFHGRVSEEVVDLAMVELRRLLEKV